MRRLSRPASVELTIRNRLRGRRLLIEPLEQRTLLATFTVTNTQDIGGGTLRNAISAANATPGPDFIEFNIPGGEACKHCGKKRTLCPACGKG